MSGFEVAGVVLGALPLVISALSAYKASKSPLSVWKRYRGLLDDLVHRLQTHRTLYYVNILSLLREARVPEVLQHSDPTEEECVQILSDSKAGVHVEDFLGQLYQAFIETLRYYETYLKEIASCLNNLARLENAPTDDLEAIIIASKATSGVQAIKAKWKFSINRQRLDALVKDLHTERIPGDLHRAPRNPTVAFGLYFPLEVNILHEVDITFHSTGPSYALVEAQVKPRTGLSAPHIEVTANQESNPNRKKIRSICDNAREARTQGRVLTLKLTACTLELSEEIKPHKPCESSITLAEFLEETERQHEARMLPLEQTILALDVVSSVLQLRTTVWCPAPWNNRNIRFPIRSINGSCTTMCNPFLEQTVDEALLHGHQCLPGLDTQAIQSTMLELAILLLEIFHHKSLKAWAEKYGEGKMCSDGERTAGARRWLRMSVEDRAERVLPDQIKAVEGCLEYCVKSKLDWDTTFQSGYFENVIKPLQRIALG
ncbi:hypothetical protein FSARC_5597 [Fusarium sarcochroum]|uniref:DUF7580 domain-containing protein n=1 Tax=Fusarium sarcochroum TaxID=1208366 RepID=A0A8H4TZ58_9HYPO|nr:hypothetical protein FSARC_5597 [Fusarium sarcochroum]